MASRGRPPNLLRSAARQAGEKFYADQFACDFCGTNKRYVSNAGCVECAIARGNARYHALDEKAKAEVGLVALAKKINKVNGVVDKADEAAGAAEGSN